MSERIPSKIFRLVAVGSLLLSACEAGDRVVHPTLAASQTPITTPVPSDVFETPEPLPTETVIPFPSPSFVPTIQPSLTPTEKPTVKPSIPENPRSFEGVGQIASVELNPADGKWYGIDTLGRAEILYNGGEWVRFNRPVYGADFMNTDLTVNEYGISTKYVFDIEGFDITEIPQSEVTLLTDNEGAPVAWGYQQGTMFWVTRQGTGTDTKFTTGYSDDIPEGAVTYYGQFAGYFLGTIKGDIWAIVLVAITYFMFKKFNKWYLLLFLFGIVIVILSLSRSALLSLSIGAIFVYFRSKTSSLNNNGLL